MADYNDAIEARHIDAYVSLYRALTRDRLQSAFSADSFSKGHQE